MSKTWILVLAGGGGTRFWPASTRQTPKHLLPLLPDGRTLLQATLDRAAALTDRERIFVVTSADQADAVRENAGDRVGEQGLIVEPVPRNTGPAIALALVALSLRGAGAHDPVIVLPADAGIDDDEAFRACLRTACAAAVAHKSIVTVGVPPTRPATGYGYLGLGAEEEVEGAEATVRAVLQFREKPDHRTAKEWVASGNFWWNAGIFVFRLGYLWYVMGELREDLDLAMATMGACLQQDDRAALAAEYSRLESISIDYAVMEKAPSVLGVGATFGWSDLGSWDAIAEVLGALPGGVGVAASAAADDADGNVVWAPGRKVGLLGVSGLIVAVTDDAVLVADRERAQEVKGIAAALANSSGDA